MSTPCYSSMCICMCQHFSTQKHSFPEGDRQGVAFTPFQYEQHIEKIKSAISPKSLPNIPTYASGSEFPQILLDKIFPDDYSRLTQSTFSTPLGLTSTAQKPYSSGPNIPPQGLGMIISAIILLRYNMPHRASHILNPYLNLLIKSSISSSGGHTTPAFHKPQVLSTIFKHLQLDPVIQNFFIDGLTEFVTTDQPHFKCHNDSNDNDPPCTQSLGKFINSFEPHTQNTTNIQKNLSQQTISFISHSKIGLPDFSKGIELWKFCININNPKFLNVPPNVTSEMDWS
ncbi:hypothetical protein O181_107865 [Austropuccinia psidii MF-1]|uniref:Uncharacterized protein n=1 Tax=Austropuccinia psidii MF-1 TaxID=1389203 RepID=A0A9Q3JVC4_9BASI|nr:hypothetical protein [Austropuccinia psidii MF-1]